MKGILSVSDCAALSRMRVAQPKSRTCLEIGFGGTALIEQLAPNDADTLYVGVDLALEWCKRLYQRTRTQPNIVTVHGDALALLSECASSWLDEVLIIHPSPVSDSSL